MAFYEFFDDITEINYFDSAMEQQIKKAFVIFYQMTRHNPLVSRLSAFLKSKRTSKTAKNITKTARPQPVTIFCFVDKEIPV